MGKFRRLENGFGNISKLNGNRRKPFRARKTIGYNENGNQLYETVGYYKSYTDAFEALVEYNKNPYDLSNKDLTLGEFVDGWYEMFSHKVSLNTLKAYKTSINKIEHLRTRKFADIDTDTIQKLVNELKTEQPKKHLKQLFTQLYKYAREKDIFKKDYAEFVYIKEGEETKVERKPFTNKEIKLCYDNQDNEVYAMTFVLLCTGFRPSEITDLKKENIHLNENYIIGGGKTKAGSNRRVPISKHIKPILQRWIERDNPNLLLNSKGWKLTYKTLSTQFKDIMSHHTLHECRHTFISNMDRLDCNTRIVKKIVGHATSDVTEAVYTHKTNLELQEAIDKYDEFLDSIL